MTARQLWHSRLLLRLCELLSGRGGFCLGSFNVGLMSPLVCKVCRLCFFQQFAELVGSYLEFCPCYFCQFGAVSALDGGGCLLVNNRLLLLLLGKAYR